MALTRSLKINRDIILANKRQQHQERQRITPLEAMRALAQAQNRPRYVLEEAQSEQRVVLIGQVTRTPTYDPVSAALTYISEGADAIAFFTDHAIYDNDFDDMLMVARGMHYLPIIYQNYLIDEYSVVTARASDASGLVAYASLMEPAMLRRVVSMGQRWKMSTLVQGHDPDQLIHIAGQLSPHVVCLGDVVGEPVTHWLPAFYEMRRRLPYHTKAMLTRAAETLEEAKLCIEAGVDALIVGDALLRHRQKAAYLRQMLQRE